MRYGESAFDIVYLVFAVAMGAGTRTGAGHADAPEDDLLHAFDRGIPETCLHGGLKNGV